MNDDTIYATQSKPLNPLSALKVRVTALTLFLERGSLTTNQQQFPMAFIHDVDASQTMTQKVRNVGTVTIKVIRPNSHPEVYNLEDLPDFRQLVACINDISHRARIAETQFQRTQHFTTTPFQPMPQAQPAPAAPAPSASDDIMSQLERLGSLKAAGVLSDEEFAAKKAELLARL